MRKGFLYSNDRQGQYPDSWYVATANHLPPFPPQCGDEQADVCVIGAGYTGLSSALHLAEAGYKVIVLEAHRVGWGASGRNGGQVGTGQNKDQHQLEVAFGKTIARALWDFSLDSVQLCKDLIHKHHIDCDLQAGIIHADHRARFVPASRAYAEKLQRDYGYEHYQFLDKEAIRHEMGSPDYHGGTLDTGAAHLHPLNFVLGLAKAAQAAGAVIYENSPVIRYERGDPAHIHLTTGKISARHVILACNGYLDGLEPKITARVMPINNYIVATEPLSEDMASSLLRNRYAVADSRFVVSYFRLSADRRLLFGGGENYSFQFPADIYAMVRPRLLEVYPQLNNVLLEYAWGGTLAITSNRLPHFERLAPNVYSASGYSGHGVANATFAGKLMAEVITGTAERFDLMANIPNLPFPGGALFRWPMLVAAMLYYSMRDRL